MTWIIFTASILAVFRLSTMFAKESGPARIFRKLRNLPDNSTAKEGLSCALCHSVWWSAAVTGFLWWQGTVEPVWTPLWWLAISGGSVALTPVHVLVSPKK